MSAQESAKALAVLVSLPGLGPARGRWLLSASNPKDALGALRAGRLPEVGYESPRGVSGQLVERWVSSARKLDEAELMEQHRSAGVSVLAPGSQFWPFKNDPEPPLVLFAKGDLSLLMPRLRVAIVGTRRCTAVGRRVASSMGADLAASGVVVVSGLALGIDAAAHGFVTHGAADPLVPGPLAVVASGLDRIYPARNRDLWHEVGERGLLVSEAPLGTSPERWRFPARNRLIAGLSAALVVVESHDSGGALLTVDEALARNVEVFAVPGSVLSAASEGTNSMLCDGMAPVRSAGDILDYLGLSGATAGDGGPEGALAGLEAGIFDQVSAEAMHLDALAAALDADVGSVMGAVQRLIARGAVTLSGGQVSVQ